MFRAFPIYARDSAGQSICDQDWIWPTSVKIFWIPCPTGSNSFAFASAQSSRRMQHHGQPLATR